MLDAENFQIGDVVTYCPDFLDRINANTLAPFEKRGIITRMFEPRETNGGNPQVEVDFGTYTAPVHISNLVTLEE